MRMSAGEMLDAVPTEALVSTSLRLAITATIPILFVLTAASVAIMTVYAVSAAFLFAAIVRHVIRYANDPYALDQRLREMYAYRGFLTAMGDLFQVAGIGLLIAAVIYGWTVPRTFE